MSGSGPGYMQTIIVTPYMHKLTYQVLCMLRKHGSLKQFSGQGITNKQTESSCNLYHRFVGKVQQIFHSEEEKLIWIPVIRIFQALRRKTMTFGGTSIGR